MSQQSQFPHHDGFASFGLAEQPPDSPDPLNTMDGLGGHSDLAVQAFGHYTAMATQGAGSHNTFGNLAGYGNNQSQQNFGLGGDIYRFIQNHDQTRLEPWNPVRAAGVSSWAPNYSSTPFTEYRNSAPPPSETDTVGPRPGRVLSDSGYGSAARPSIGIPSYNGDDNPETQSLVQQYNQHGINLETISNSTHDRPRRRKVRSQRGGSTRSNVTLRCLDCSDFYAKTNSELRKHRARHEKPYKCDVEHCPKFKNGFSTNNDLERHKICVHKVYGADVSLYRCKIDTCKDKSKDWPRQDNFRQHLKRVHNFDAPNDLSQFLHNPNEPKGQSMVGASEHTPSEAGRHANSDQVSLPNQVSQLSWPVLDQGQAIPTGPLDGFSVDLGIVQPVDMHQFSTHSVLDQSDYASVMSPTECPPQEQAPLDSGHLAVDMEPLLSGLIPPRFQQDDGSTPRGQPLGDQSCIAPNILDHTNMEICHMEQALEVQIPHKEMIHLDDDSPVGYQEQTFADHRQIEPEISTSPDSMVLDVDEPVQESTPDNGSGLENAEAEDDDTADFHNLSKLSEHLAAECTPDVSSSPELLMTPSPPASNEQTPEMLDSEDLEDPRDVEASALAALKSLMALKEKGGLKDKEVLDKFFLKLGYQKSEEIDVKEVKAPGTPYAQSEVGSHKCNDCTKAFGRACELKKHMKRHEKPYACTFNLCEKRFGSKNDWKRHENGQHYQLEIWRCDEVTGDGVNLACGKVYHRRESLKSHLEKDHQLTDSAFIDRKLAECRHGRNFETRFWCGFCARTIEPQGCGGPTNSERFDHIDDHFMGRNGFEKADIATWKSLHAVDSVDFSASSEAAAPTVVDNITRKRGLEEDANTAVASSSSSSSTPSSRPSSGKTKKTKRKGVKAEIFWTCCNCANCWNVDVTNQCLDSCNHTQCRNCPTWENEVVAEQKREREGRGDSSNDF